MINAQTKHSLQSARHMDVIRHLLKKGIFPDTNLLFMLGTENDFWERQNSSPQWNKCSKSGTDEHCHFINLIFIYLKCLL